MDIVMMAILTLALVLAIGGYIVMGIRRHVSMNDLKRHAARRGVQFSHEDPISILQQQGQFSLLSSGHSPQVCDVMHGRIAQQVLSAFDFRYEVGHGTRRMTRRYHVALLHLPHTCDDLLLWSQGDDSGCPLAVLGKGKTFGAWRYVGSREQAERLAALVQDVSLPAACLEVRGESLLMAVSNPRRRQEYTLWVDKALAIASQWSCGHGDRQDSCSRKGIPRDNPVANVPAT